MENSDMIFHESLLREHQSLVGSDIHWLSNLANTAAFLMASMPDVSWAGWYLFDGTALQLGPFVGPVACTTITPPHGVCGTAFAEQKTMCVPDVSNIENHIACDPKSRSELVVPLTGDFAIGVLDLDSYTIGRFGAQEAAFCEQVVKQVIDVSDFTRSLL